MKMEMTKMNESKIVRVGDIVNKRSVERAAIVMEQKEVIEQNDSLRDENKELKKENSKLKRFKADLKKATTELVAHKQHKQEMDAENEALKKELAKLTTEES